MKLQESYSKELRAVLQTRVVSALNIYNISFRLNNTYLNKVWSVDIHLVIYKGSIIKSCPSTARSIPLAPPLIYTK